LQPWFLTLPYIVWNSGRFCEIVYKELINQTQMTGLKSYLRHLVKNKLYTLVTVAGFAISLTFILLLSVYIENELSVDDFHVNRDRIYRMENEEDTSFAVPIAEDLKNSIPDIEDYTRIYKQESIIATSDGQKLRMGYLAVDPSFLTIFSYPLLKGQATEALKTKNSIVLSRSFASKLFGNTPAIGKKLTMKGNFEFLVTGILEDFPGNTHLKAVDALINLRIQAELMGFASMFESYGANFLSIYFLEKKNTDLPSKTSGILETFKKDFWMYQEGYAKTLQFVPLKEIYFSPKEGDGTKSNSKTLIAILSVIVLLILTLAIGNYVNLTIAQATFRGREVAIKKLLGSSKKRLFFQFIRESVLLCLVAVILAVLLAKLTEPVFNSLLDTQLQLNEKITGINILVLTGAFCALGFVSGIMPALKITGFRPIEVVRGSFRKKSKAIYGKAFITFQYTVAIALLACSWLILKQTNFLRNYDLGFQREHIVKTEYRGALDQKGAIKNALAKIPGVEAISLTWQSPLSGGSNQSFDFEGMPMSFQEFRVDSTFFKVFDISVQPTKVAYSQEGVYLNRSAIQALGYTLDNVPASFTMHEEKIPVLGVVNDFNFNHLRETVGPLMIRQQKEETFVSDVFLKINPLNRTETLDAIKNTYASLIDNAPFDLRFVDDAINQWYEKDERTGKIIGYFTLLSFIISAMGILAMSTFYMQQRKKEIGIRKVNGATITQILSLLNKDFVKWVGLAFIMAVPISWYAMNQWLQGFAYKTSVSWWAFALAGLTALAIALITVSWQSFQAAVANPVDALKDE
jgi:putative ABC transport system permease protein